MTKLIVEPDNGIQPVLRAIEKATRTIDVLIFRLDCKTVTRHLEEAVERGVVVRALIARKHQGGVRDLRRLERRLLRAGAVLARTAGDLTRYHGKMMIVDGQVLHVYGFNFTDSDYRSRSFGIVTRDGRLVQEALKLFEADATRQRYRTRNPEFVVSPENSRAVLSAFIRDARRQLFIYDPQLADESIQRLLVQRALKGVDVRIIGKAAANGASGLDVRKYPGRRLHVRAMVRDGERAFVGSQSLRNVAFDRRREIGVIVRDPGVVGRIRAVFERDWTLTTPSRHARDRGRRR
jgi:cardiolipin synthase A/B